jgi:hypothetical protein
LLSIYLTWLNEDFPLGWQLWLIWPILCGLSAIWPSTFVKRQPELQVKFNRKYDYKRALCKDPECKGLTLRVVARMIR